MKFVVLYCPNQLLIFVDIYCTYWRLVSGSCLTVVVCVCVRALSYYYKGKQF